MANSATAFKILLAALATSVSIECAAAAPFSGTRLESTTPELTLASEKRIIGTSSGWIPLEKMAERVGIGKGYVQRLIDANADYACDLTSSDGKTKSHVYLNAWFLNDQADGVYTSAHVILDRAGDFYPLADCHVLLRRDLMGPRKAPAFPVDMNRDHYLLAPAESAGKFAPPTLRQDRAWIPLASAIPGPKPLPVYPDRAKIAEGEWVVMVTSGYAFGSTGLMAQACTSKRVFGALGGKPGGLLTDCNHKDGVSAALYIAKDASHCETTGGREACEWIPVAFHSGSREVGGDNLPWDEKTNTAMAIVMDRLFYFDRR